MKWIGVVLMFAGLIGVVILWDVQWSLSMNMTNVMIGRDVHITQLEYHYPAALPAIGVFVVGLITFLVRRKSTK